MPREVAESSGLVQSLKGVVITGSSVLVEGTLVAAPEGKEQARIGPWQLPLPPQLLPPLLSGRSLPYGLCCVASHALPSSRWAEEDSSEYWIERPSSVCKRSFDEGSTWSELWECAQTDPMRCHA